MNDLLSSEGYNPSALFDELIERAQLKGDAHFARTVGVQASTICRIRKKGIPITSTLLVRLHDVYDMGLDDLRRIAGIPKTKIEKEA